MVGIKLRRGLHHAERILAEKVFGNTLPWDKIIVSNTIGAGKRQYVTPEFRHDGGWVMHLGPEMYRGESVFSLDYVFIHELTHVWQGYNSPFRWGYVFNSMCHQILLMKGEKAYDYQIGKSWSEYNSEQQAEIVMYWYYRGMDETDDHFPYIRDHIRKGKN